MKLDDWAYRGNKYFYDRKLKELAGRMPPEKWGFNEADEYSVLRNYLFHTFDKLWEEREDVPEVSKAYYIYEDDHQACFNTGLFDNKGQCLYFYCELNPNPLQKWRFKTFFNSYTIQQTDIPAKVAQNLKRPNYFKNPADLIYNINLNIVPQWDHILDNTDNYQRIPKEIRENGKDFTQGSISWAIQKTQKKIIANYKTVVPQWYEHKIQLLAPLYLTNEENPDLALVLSLNNDSSQYLGHTCLTIEMAYNNARLIAKPDSQWLYI